MTIERFFFCDEDREGKRISRHKIKKQDSFALFIGPVGGWSLKDRVNFESLKINKVNLGKNILKADTAAIVCLSGLRDLIDE